MPAGGYLARCLELFGPTIEERFGWRPDYAGLERALQPVREGRRELAAADIETIQSGRYWDFRQFWRFPDARELARELDFAAIAAPLGRLPLDEEATIGRLHTAFKYIENVSVVLRFLHPDHYGIISPPVEKVLEVRRGRSDVETYLNYLAEIRAVREHHALPRAADADMALWVLQERVLSGWSEPELRRAWREDEWMLRRRAVNLLSELPGLADPLVLARALAEANTGLAGALASFEFERRMRAARGASAATDGVAPDGPLGRAARIRDALLGRGPRPGRAEVIELIEAAERLGDTSQEEEHR